MPIFMKIEGVDGSVTARGYEKWHELFSYSWGESLVKGPFSGGGAGAGKVLMQDFSVMMSSGQGAPVFAFMCAAGRFLPAVQIEFVMVEGGHLEAYQRWKLENVQITSYQTGAGGGDAPVDTLSLNFGKVKFEQRVFSATGSSRFQEFHWDVRAGSGGFTP